MSTASNWTICGGCFDVEEKSRRLEEIKSLESDPEFWNNNQKAAGILKEKKIIELTISPVQDLNQHIDDGLALIELCEEAGDVEGDMASELQSTKEKIETEIEALKMQSILQGETDGADCYLSIHAGAGGTEACDWCSMLARMYTRYCAKQNFQATIVDFTDGDGAGYRSVTFEITGPFAYGFLKAEMGVHRLVRISPFDSNKRRHTSFASVDVYPMVEDDVDIEIRDEDLRIDTYRASGAGGQHVNKTESAVRMTHLPTNTVVQCQSERSQIQNRAHCMRMLKSKLYELEMQKKQAEADKANAEKKKIEWGSQIRNYVMQPYQLIKDVRTGHESSNIDKVMDGDIQQYIEAYLLAQAE